METIQDFFKIGTAGNIPSIKEWDKNGLVLNLGCGSKLIDGAINLDCPEWDANTSALPVNPGTVDCIRAYHFLEHINNPIGMLDQFQQALKSGGVANIIVPYYTSQMQAHDLSHKSFWCEMTWANLFGNPYYTKDREGWEFVVGLNLIIGTVERNLCLMTQLIRK